MERSEPSIMSVEPRAAGPTVVGIYQVKNGKESEAQELIEQHWPLLQRHGLVTNEPVRVYKGEWGSGWFFFEIATWASDEALHSAFSIPEIAGVWNQIKELSENRNGHDGVEYPIVSQVPAAQGAGEEPGGNGVVTGVAIHQLRPEHVQDMHELVAREWRGLHEEGFTPEQKPLAFIGMDRHGAFSLHLLDWFEVSGPQRAFMNSRINAIWRDVQRYTVGRAGRPASEYLWVEEVVCRYATEGV
jgi:hypothetical protein